MGVRHFSELRAWQLANRLRIEIYRFITVSPAMNDRRFCDDISASSSSICSNIAEGFGRYTHPEFAQFVNVARGSLAETQDHLLNARDRGYVTAEKFEDLWKISVQAMAAATALWTYLKRSPRPRPQTRQK